MTTVALESSDPSAAADEAHTVLAQLLSELADVFLKAEGFDDALKSAEWANDEADRLRAETVTYAERVLEQESEIERLQERDDFNRLAKAELSDEVERLRQQYAEASEEAFQRNRLLQVRDETIRAVKAQLDTARRSFGDALVYGARPGAGPNRANRPKLTAAQVGGIRSMVGNGSKIREVARVYGVHPSTVSRIARGFYYREGSE